MDGRTGRRPSCPHLVGRDAELARLRAALADSAGGAPAVVFVSGEAGVGKTRLVQEFADLARADGVKVWTGRCLPIAEGLLPYAPIVGVLRAAMADVGRDRILELAGPNAARLATLLPELNTGGTAELADELGERRQARQWAALLLLLERLADEPTLVVIEDLHWADSSTRGLLNLLIHGIRRGRLLVVCTYRDDELPRVHPWRAQLAESHRRGADRIPLGRLDLTDTAAQVSGILPQTPDPAWVGRLFARSGGNPFLVEELLALGPDDGAVAADLRDLLLVRVRHLPPVGQLAMRAVALAGRSAEHTLLADVVNAPPPELDAGLAAAVDGHLLVVNGDRYSFRHTLVAEAIVADIAPAERTRLHRALAEALTARCRRGGPVTSPIAATLAETAHHWFAAGEADQALIMTIDAGLAAEGALALPEARQHFQRALGLWWEAPQARPLASLDLVGLCHHAAETAYLLDDVEDALGLARRGIELADAAENPVRAGLLHARLGRYLLVSGRPQPFALAEYEIAVRLVPDAPTQDRAGVLAGLATTHMVAGRYSQSVHWAQRGVDLARQADARGEVAHGLCTLGTALVRLGEPEQGLADLREALAIATDIGDPEAMRRAYLNLSDALHNMGRFAEAGQVAMRGIEAARRHGADDGCLLGNAVQALFSLGRWDEMAGRLPNEVAPHGNILTTTNLWLSAAELHTAQGRFVEAHRYLEAAHNAFASGAHTQVRGQLHAGLAELCLWRGDPGGAQRWVTRALGFLADSEDGPLFARLLAAGARACADLVATRGPRADASASTEEEHAALADHVAGLPKLRHLTAYAMAHLRVAEGELARLTAGGAVEAWTAAADAWGELGAPYPKAYARLRQAEALLAQRGRRRAAARALAEARETATSLGADPLRRDIDSLASRTRLDLARPATFGSPHRASASHAAFGLTPREGDVLALLGSGCTNRQIARRLSISERTVSIHVSRILAKMSVPNRAAAASIAHRLGLLDLH